MAKNQAKQGGKKKGRNSKGCLAYRHEQREHKNKLRRVRKHLRKHGKDASAIDAVKKLAGVLHFKPETFHDLQHVRW